MDYELRTFDESRDLESFVSLYNTVFGPLRPYYSWPITAERFRDKVLSHWEFRPEGFWLAFAGGELIGFLLAGFRDLPLMDRDVLSVEMSPVFLSAVGVAAGHRRRGVGRALCEKAAAFARDNGRTRLAVSANPRAPMALFIGVQEDWREAHCFFSSAGFDAAGTCQNMVRGIAGYELDEPVRQAIARLATEGCECREYRESDYPALTELLAEHDWAYWDLDMLSKVGKWTKTRPFMETCFLECATEEIYGPDEIGVVVKDGAMLSFCAQTLNPRKRMTYLGPMLTRADARNQGLGMIALQISLRQAARKGAVVCDLWTGMAGHVTHFYKKSGFRQVMRWFDYERKLR